MKKRYDSLAEKQKAYRARKAGEPEPAEEDGKATAMKAGPADRPEGCTEEEWDLCKERAARAARYAVTFPEHMRPSEVVFQDPVWQWENEVGKGRAVPVGKEKLEELPEEEEE